MNPIRLLSLLCVYNRVMPDCNGHHLWNLCEIPIHEQVVPSNTDHLVIGINNDEPLQLQDVFKKNDGKEIHEIHSETGKPDVRLSMDGHPIKDEITIDRVKDLKMQVEGSQIKEVKVYINDQPQDLKWSNGQAVLSITPKEQTITIVVEDTLGNKNVEKRIIHRRKEMDFKLSVDDDSYTLDQSVRLTFKESLGSEYRVVLEQSEHQQTFDCTNEKSMMIQLKHSGKTTIYVQKKNDLKDISKKHSFYFTNDTPSIHFVQDGDKVKVVTDGDWIQEKKLIVNGAVIPWTPTIDISTPIGKDQTISLIGSVRDSFGQTHQSELLIRIDRKPPTVIMKINGQSINSTYIMDTCENAQIQTDENSSIECAYFKNGQPFSASSLQEAVTSLLPADVLQIHVLATDTSGNQSSQIYKIHRNRLLKEAWVGAKDRKRKANRKQFEPVTLKTYFCNPHSIQYRTWGFDTNRRLRFIQKQTKTQAVQPVIRVLVYKGKQKRIRILLEKDPKTARFIFIRINGKKISLRKLKKDELGNTYYQFYIKGRKIHIEAQAGHSSGSVKNLDRTISNKQVHRNVNSYWKMIDHWFWIIRHG